MKAQNEAAEALMNAPSKLFVKEEPFLFGCASMWYLYYSEPGTMLETADKFAEAMKVYYRLTIGHGAGAAETTAARHIPCRAALRNRHPGVSGALPLRAGGGTPRPTYGAALLLGINAIYRSGTWRGCRKRSSI
jgi:hypothetical protein